MEFYTGPKDVQWIISTMIGCFIIIFKNSKIRQNKFKSYYYFSDMLLILLVFFIIKTVPNEYFFAKISGLAMFIVAHLHRYSKLILDKKITFVSY
jgi:hypothetical protein